MVACVGKALFPGGPIIRYDIVDNVQIGVKNIPKPRPSETRRLAQLVTRNLLETGMNYSRDLMRTFQSRAGIPSSGIYDGATRSALRTESDPSSFLPAPHTRDRNDKSVVTGRKSDPRTQAGDDEDEGSGSSIRA